MRRAARRAGDRPYVAQRRSGPRTVRTVRGLEGGQANAASKQGCGDLWSRGAIGGAVARAFARDGAKVFLTGRRRASVEALAKEIASAGGSAEAAEVDALDEQAVDKHLQSVIDKAGRVDISFNAVGLPNAKTRVPLVELDVEQFSLPIATYTRSYFLTARLAARRMIATRSGVIMTVTATI